MRVRPAAAWFSRSFLTVACLLCVLLAHGPLQRAAAQSHPAKPEDEIIWPSGVGPRVEEPALVLINPYPWSAPLEEVRLKKK